MSAAELIGTVLFPRRGSSSSESGLDSELGSGDRSATATKLRGLISIWELVGNRNGWWMEGSIGSQRDGLGSGRPPEEREAW